MSNQIESVLFAPYKALGLVSGAVPSVLVHVPRAKLHAVLCAVGDSVHTYRSRKLALWGVSEPLGAPISCLAADQRRVYAACEKSVKSLHFGRNVERTFDGHEANIKHLLVFGDHLVSVDETSRLIVWDTESGEIFNETNFGADQFFVTSLCHPSTYLNKLLLGSKQGPMKLFNLKTNKLIFEFTGWNCEISCMQQSPAVDIVGVGLFDGRILLHNLKMDHTVVTFKQDWGKVCALTFRIDGPPLIISSSTEGHLAVWDLEKRRLQTQMQSAHNQAVTTLISMPGEPLLLTSSGDNALKMWIFDQADGRARLLHCREGHAQPPTFVRFHAPDGSYVLSAGKDGTLKAFHTRKDHLHKNLGSAGLIRRQVARKKDIDWERVRLPPCVYLSSNTTRECGWDNVLCCHENHLSVTTWTSRRNHLGDHILKHERFVKNPSLKKSHATRCFVTSCGNFAVIGYSTGHVDVFNVQSGLHRGTFVDPGCKNDAEKSLRDRAHKAPISGLQGDHLNVQAVTSCEGGLLKIWAFKTKSLVHVMKMESGVQCTLIHPENNLLAVGLQNFSLCLVDLEFRRLVRYFPAVHQAPLTDLTFDPSGRWLLSSSLDCTVKVWDLTSACLIDVLCSSEPCLSLTFSPTADFLATVHRGSLGVYLWASKSLYTKKLNIKPLPLDFRPETVARLPRTLQEQEGGVGMEGVEEQTVGAYISPPQLSANSISFSGYASPRWANLMDWDAVKEKNKPKEPPKKPKQAPFFLPTVSGLEPTFDAANSTENPAENSSQPSNKILGFYQLDVKSDFGRKLDASKSDSDFQTAFQLLKAKNPSAIDVELQNLSPFYGGSKKLIENFLKMSAAQLKTNVDFELANSFLALFLKLHRDVLWGDENLTDDDAADGFANLDGSLCLVQQRQAESWSKLDGLNVESLCLINYVKSALL